MYNNTPFPKVSPHPPLHYDVGKVGLVHIGSMPLHTDPYLPKTHPPLVTYWINELGSVTVLFAVFTRLKNDIWVRVSSQELDSIMMQLIFAYTPYIPQAELLAFYALLIGGKSLKNMVVMGGLEPPTPAL